MAQVAEPKKEKKLQIGEYTLTGKIGQGGIAEIFKGVQESLGRDVAVKILSSELSRDPDIVRRFERESMVIARLNHPNIVHVIDKGYAGGRYYFVMEFVDGTSLREVIDSPKVPKRTKLEMIAQICKALDYAHKNGVIHRDIKPANILIDRQGNPRVADFGIAQIIGTPDSEMTSSDVIMGTVAYMSPEQKVSSTNVDHTTDIWAIGIIIYEILTGKKPEGRFRMPSEIDPSNGPAMDEIIQKCLAVESKDRYQSAAELKDEILEAIGGRQIGSVEEVTANGAESFIGKCKYLDTIKETPFGSTILVENKVNKKLYVIKKHSRGEAGRKEAKLLATMKHKNIINILGSGGEIKNTVIISEYAQGGSLADRMVRKYEWPKAMEVMLEVASGLDFAHKNNIVHGNVRPSNILFTAAEEIKLCDFGLPVHYDDKSKKNWYAAPEHKQSKQADIYALGVVLHQLMLGRTPQYDPMDNLKLDDARMQIPEAIQNVLAKALAVRVTNRYTSCAELLADWEDFRRQQDEARRRPIVPDEQSAPAKKPLPTWAVAAAIAGAILIIVGVVLVIVL